MSKKLILFLMLAIFGSTNLLKADEVTIGDPAGATTSSYYPTYSMYNYSFNQQIYAADEIGMAGTINSLTMWLKNASSYSRNVQIYMKNVSKAAFGGLTDWVPMSAEDLVATGTINNGVSTPEAVTFTLSTPFEYDGESNLVICFADVTGQWSSGAASVTFAGEATRTLYIYRDASAFDIANPGTANNGDTSRSVVMLDITPAGGSVVVTPSTLDLERPNNAWMEPAYINVKNTNPDGAVVSTSFVTYPEMFDASTMLNNVELAYKEEVDVEIRPAAGAEGTAEAAMVITFDTPEKDAVVATVNADFYTAAQPDVVEFAQAVIADTMSFAPDFSALHHNYNLPNAIEGGKDAVYTFTLTTPKVFSAYTTGNGHVALYDTVQPKADNALMEAASFEDVILLPGTYYLIAESAGEFELYVQLEDFQPLTEAPTLVAPGNGAMEVATAPTLAWTLPEGTVEYRLLVNTAYNLPEETSVVVDWTTELAESYTLAELYGATQYFWRVDARGADGTVMNSAKWGFTTTISAPTNLVADDYTIFEGDDVQLEWKGGVSTGFEGEITVSDGTATDSYVPVYGLYTDAYLKCNIVYPAEMLEEMEGGEITSMKFYLSTPASAAWDPAHFVVYMMEVPGTTVSAFTEPENATIVYEGSLNGTGTEMVVTLDTPFEYEGGNLLVGVNNTVIGTYKSCSFTGTTVSGASVQGYSYSSLSAITPTQRNFIPKTTFVCGDAKGSINDRTFIGFNLYDNDVKVNDELILEKKYTVSGLTYNMDGHHFAVTEVHSEGESGYSNIANVQVSGNGYASGIVYDIDGVTPLEGITVMFNGQDEFGDDVEYSAVTAETGFYYTELKAGNYIAKTVHPEFTSVKAEIVVTYDETTTTDFILHENYNPAGAVVAEEIDETMAKVSWSLGSMPGPGGAGDEFFFGFESDLEGWTNIDNDGDGHVWYHSSEAGNHSTMAVTSHTGAGHVMGESYCNASWLALTPDDYMVTPEKYNIGGSSVFTFWACAQDVNYPAEHFGVAVSTADNTSAADFTTVAEWTLTAKGDRTFRKAEAKAKVRGENTREGTWYQYQVDLSAYAGQQAWIAIRHFNCSDQFMMCVDDVEMLNAPAPGKGGRSLQYYTVYRRKTMEEGATTMIPEEELNPEVISAICTDTAYVDFNWGNMETGVYQYGVQVTYDGNHNPTRENDNIYLETFDVNGLNNWNNIDADGDGHLWELAAGHTGDGAKSVSWESSNYKGSDAARRGNASQKENGRASYNPDNWLISPEITIPSTAGQEGPVQLSWYVQGGSSSYPDHYGVYVSTTGDQPADFTTQVYEGTSPASWTQLTVDLSAYIGQTVRVAFRHYDSYDKWSFTIDDVTVYEYEEPEPVVCDPITTFPYFNDFEDFLTNHDCWVSIDNDGDGYSWFTDTEAYWGNGFGAAGSNCLLSQSYDNYTGSRDADNYLLSPEFELPAGSTVTLSWYEQSQDGSYPDSYEVMVAPNGSTDINDFVSIYSGVAANPWTERTADLSAYAGTTVRVVFHHESEDCYFLEIDNLSITAEGGSDPDSPVTGITWSNMLGKNMDMTLNLAVAASNMGDVRGAHVTMTNISEEYAAIVYEAELDSTGLYTFEGFRKGNYMVTVECPTYATFTEEVAFWGDQTYTVALAEDYAPVSNFAVSSTGWAHWTAPLGNIDHYQVMMNNVFQGNTEMNGMQLDVEGLTEGQTYTAKVAAVYTTGMSTWETATFSYKDCGNFETGIEALSAFADCMDVTFSWGGGVPTPPTPGDGDEFFEEFETGAIPTGWTTIDADGDGHNWTPASVLMAGYVIPAHGGVDCITSQSYDASYGPLTPDNYLVSPKVKITTGSEFSFWACAQDPSYPSEHYGVAISTTTATAGAFTTIAEWTMTAKEEAGAGAYMSRDGKGTREGNWYQKTVDLSSYAGQEVYIAIRHFNCTDWFYLNVDDARLQIAGAPVPPPTGEATIVLQADDVWGDGSGYQMLLDNTHSLYGTTIPETGALSMNCSGNEGIYAQFSHKIPANADGNCSTSNMVCGNSASITIPAGTYDWCITNPTPGDRIWIASSGGSIGGRYNDYTFEGGKTYTFHVYFGGANDATDLTISGGKSAQPKMAVESNDCKNISDVVVLNGTRDEYLQYCTENYSGAVGTGGGQVWWANAYTPAQLAAYDGKKITKVGQWVSAPDVYGNIYDGTYNVEVYVGGSTSAPGTLVASASQYITGDDAWHDLELNEPVTIDATQHIWFVFNANGIGYPMCGCDYVGDPNSDVLSLDGTTWEHALSYDLPYTWMIRALVEAGGPTPGPDTPEMTENTWALFLDGEFIECVSLDQTSYGMTMNDTEEHEFTVVRVYSSFDMSCPTSVVFAAGGVSMPANLTAEDTEDGVRLTWVGFADTYKVYRGTSMSDFVEIGTTNDLTYLDGFNGGSYYGVRAVTDCGESDMAIVSYDNVGELNTEVAIYPNPTSGDVNILVNGMQQVTIVNTLGQVVFSQNVNADQMTINMSQFGTGMFIINIVTENGTSTKRVNVIK